MKVHENAPLDDAVAEVQVVVGVAPPNVNVPIVMLGVKPEPATVTEVPAGPPVGVRIIAGLVTVNEADAVSVPPSEPVATTMYAPTGLGDGTIKVHANVPVELVVCEVQVLDGVLPPKVKMLIATFGVNPLPLTATESPTGP